MIGIVLLVLGYSYLKGKNLFNKSTILYVEYERIDGLGLSSPVLIKGLDIGQVLKLEIIEEGERRILATLEVNNSVAIPKNSVARLISSDLLGTKAIQLEIPANEDETIGIKNVQSGDTLLGAIQLTLMEEVSKQVDPVRIRAQQLLGSIDSIITTVHYFLSAENMSKVDSSFSSLQSTLANFSEASFLIKNETHRLHAIFSSFQSISQNLEENNKAITKIINNISDISDSVKKSEIIATINNANQMIQDVNEITTKINNGEGTIGMLIHNDSLYLKITQTAASLDALLVDVKESPRRYFSLISFGSGKRKDKKKNKSKE